MDSLERIDSASSSFSANARSNIPMSVLVLRTEGREGGTCSAWHGVSSYVGNAGCFSTGRYYLHTQVLDCGAGSSEFLFVAVGDKERQRACFGLIFLGH